MRLRGSQQVVLGNYIGVGVDGVTAVPNKWDGIYIAGSQYQIGGLAPGEANVIAHNQDSGIAIIDFLNNGQGNTLRGNMLYDNGKLGIDIGLDDITENDPLDVDDGGNGRLNFPTISSAATSGQILGSYSGAASQPFTLDFYSSENCHSLGHGEAEVYLGSTDITTDANGAASFNITVSSLTSTHSISATAIDASGNTSEFSACAYVGGVAPSPLPLSLTTNCLTATAPPTSNSEAIYLPLIISSNNAQPRAAQPNVVNSLLTDGGVVTGVDGVSIGAIAGTLPTAIDVTISATAVPTPTIMADPTVHGNYYHIAASQNVLGCDREAGFIVGLPIPTGVSNENLAVAVLPHNNDAWMMVPGLYDAQSDLMLVHILSISEDGSTIVLIENAGFDSLSSGVNEEPLDSELELERPLPQTPAQANGSPVEFVDICITTANGCGNWGFLKDFLELVYIEMSDMGYPDPYLPCAYDDLSMNPPIGTCKPNSYIILIVAPDTGLTCTFDQAPSGVYWRERFGDDLPQLQFCPPNTTQLFNIDKRAIRYHYFQSIQFGWPDHQATWLDFFKRRCCLR